VRVRSKVKSFEEGQLLPGCRRCGAVVGLVFAPVPSTWSVMMNGVACSTELRLSCASISLEKAGRRAYRPTPSSTITCPNNALGISTQMNVDYLLAEETIQRSVKQQC